MEISIVTAVLGNAGGMGRVVEEQATRLALRGHKVRVFFPALRDGSMPANVPWEPVSVKPVFRFGHGAWLSKLTTLLGDAPLVHLHYPCLGGVRSVLRWRRLHPQSRLVVTYHMDLLGRGIFRFFFRLYQRVVVARVARVADLVIASSRDYALTSDLGPYLSRLGDRFSELPFGVDTDRFKPGPSDELLLRALGISPEESVVLFVGGLDRAHYFKGLAVLLKAFAWLAHETKNLRLLIVGRGKKRVHFEAITKHLQILNRVIFAPNISEDDLPGCYRLADVFVLPSIDRSEAFGLVLLEAQASGVPVIATDLPGVRTTLAPGKTGLLVPRNDARALFDALVRIMTRPSDREAMATAARVRMEEGYRWSVVIERLERLYIEIMTPKV